MYLRRKIDSYLISWKNNPEHQPLLIKGARQVGKTESIMHFARDMYANIVYVNFVEMPLFRNITANGYSVDEIKKAMTLIDASIRFIDKKTIVFFDEIQEFPDIMTALKFFSIDGRYDVICSGSMLGINYNLISHNSVGYKEEYEMKSFDFEEFLWANGYDDSIAKSMLGHLKGNIPFSELEMSTYMRLFNEYCILGGMPRVISSFVGKKSFEGSIRIQINLVENYREDIHKYASGLDRARIDNVYRNIPVQLAKEFDRFKISNIAPNARSRDYKGPIEWLKDAGLINICYSMAFPSLPLKGNYDERKYRLYFFDTGLLISMLDEEVQLDMRANRNLGIYKGRIYENIVAEALVKSGCDLYFYKKENSTLEIDFFLRTRNSLVPIEVKATNGNAKSMKTLISSDHYPDIKFGIKLGNSNIGYNGVFYTFPYFTAFLMHRFLREYE